MQSGSRRLSSFGDFAHNPSAPNPMAGLPGMSGGLPGASPPGASPPGASPPGASPEAAKAPGGAAPAMDLSGVSLGGLGGAGDAMGLTNGIEQSQDTAEVSSGIVAAFLHKQKLEKGELDCLTEGTGELSGEVMSVGAKASSLLKQFMGTGKSILDAAEGKDDQQDGGMPPGLGGLGLGGMPGMGGGMPGMGGGMPGAGGGGMPGMGGGLGGMGGAGGMPTMPKLPDNMPKLPGLDSLMKDAKAAGVGGLNLTGAAGVGDAGGGGQGQPMSMEEAERQAEKDEQEEKEAEENHQAEKSLTLFYQGRRLQMMGAAMMGMGGGAGGDGGAALAMGASSAVTQIGMSVAHMVNLVHKMTDHCVHGDAMDALKQACHRVRNTTYVSGRIIANGADVMDELAMAVAHYENKNFTNFGMDIGRLMRKVLLSNKTDGALPEGLPDKMEMANVTTGLLNGFFGSGFFLDIKADDGTSIHVDLHQCVSDNLGFFQSVWASTMYAFARKESSGGGAKNKAEFATVIGLTMMQVPRALRRCNIGSEQEEALMDSISAMGRGTNAHLTTPKEDDLGKRKASEQIAATVDDYTKTNWYNFGEDLGKLMREGALLTMEDKYAVDDKGHLRKRLLVLAGDARGLNGLRQLPAAALLALGLLALLPLVGLAALKLRRKSVEERRARWRPCRRSEEASVHAARSLEAQPASAECRLDEVE